MIRRDAGNDWLLITQTDHAMLASQLGAHFGNARFARANALQSIALHDAGWPLVDDDPMLNEQGFPLDFSQVPRATALRIWAASADRAEAVNPYSGLLVSLHSLSLSIHASAPPISHQETFDVQKMHEQFAVNKFQHREVERQEQLRRRLALSTEVHLKHGLAEPRASAEDDQLRFDFHLLQAMDLISLCLCCSKLPQNQSGDVLFSPAGKAVKLRFELNAWGNLRISPWPFDEERITLAVPCRRMAAVRFESVEAFQARYHQVQNELLNVTVVKG